MVLFSRQSRTQKVFLRLCGAALFCILSLRNYAKETSRFLAYENDSFYSDSASSNTSVTSSSETMRGHEGDIGKIWNENYFLKHSTMSSGNVTVTMTASSDEDLDHDDDCPPGFLKLRDSIVPQSITHVNTTIPRVIHLIIRERCVSPEIFHHFNTWKTLSFDDSHSKNVAKGDRRHSIIFHDQADVDEYLSKDREDLPFISNAAKCAVESIAKTDLVKFLILWDFGGIVVDVDTIPNPNFFSYGDEAARSGFGVIRINDECMVDFVPQYSDEFLSPPRFIGCMPKHYLVHSLIYMSISTYFMQFSPGNYANRTYTNQRGEIFRLVLNNEFRRVNYNDDDDDEEDKYGGRIDGDGNDASDDNYHLEPAIRKLATSSKEDILMRQQSVILIDIKQFPYPPLQLESKSMSNSTISPEVVQLEPSPIEYCINFNASRSRTTINETYIESLVKLVRDSDENGNDKNLKTCNGNNFTYIRDKYSSETMTKKKKRRQRRRQQRKIPKIIHMTSKSRCVTDIFAMNIGLWYFPDHSFFLHDDHAVNRLLDTVFPEFPLLQDIRHCVASGAGLADLWRYLLLWEYGGVYTDIDNAPGKRFKNATIIRDDTDFLVEQESGGYPSQYFMASSMKHPTSYFMVQQAIHRLLEVPIIATQVTARVTGPGATKAAVMSFIGNGYPEEGNYTGTHSRNITVLGSPWYTRRKQIVHRDSVPNEDKEYAKMDMKYFNEATGEAMQKTIGTRHSCLAEIYRRRYINSNIP